MLELCHIVLPADSLKERRRKTRQVRDHLHAMGSAFWFPGLSGLGADQPARRAGRVRRGHADSNSESLLSAERRDSIIGDDDDQSSDDARSDDSDEDDEREYVEAEEEEEERERRGGRWWLAVDLRWLLGVINGTLEAQPGLVDGGVLHHKNLAALWKAPPQGSAPTAPKAFVPDHLYVRVHALLEAMEVLWSPAARVHTAADERGLADFLAKGVSFVPALFPDEVPYNWVKWVTFLGRPTNDRFEAEMQIDKTEVETRKSPRRPSTATAAGSEEESELHLGGMEGDIKFERWWMLPFLPAGFLSRFLLRLLHNVSASASGTHDHTRTTAQAPWLDRC
jgi:hypothetical protein